MTMLPDIDAGSWLDYQRQQAQQEIDKKIGGFSLERAIGDRIAGLQSLVGAAPEPEPVPEPPLPVPAPEPVAAPAWEEPPAPPPAAEPGPLAFAPAPEPAPRAVPSRAPRAAPGPAAVPASTPAPPSAQPDGVDAWRRQTFAGALNAIEQAGGNVQTFAGEFSQRVSDDARGTFAAALNAAESAGADVQTFASLFSMPEPPRPAERLPTQTAGPAVGAPGGVNPNPSPDEVRSYIAQAAQARGIDPNIALRVAQSEGGFEAARRGTFKTGSSWWPFQLHYGGKGYENLGNVAGMGNQFTRETGYEPGDPNAWQAATDYALDKAKQSGWGAWYGAKAQGITGFQGIDKNAPGVEFLHKAGEAVQGAVRPFVEGARAAGGALAGTVRDISQFGDAQLTSEEAYAACGPAAAVRFAQRFGRNPSLREALDLAKTVGWTAAQGMAGIGSQQALMKKMGIETELVPGAQWDRFAREAQTGNPVTISTSAHYFYADGYDPNTGAFHVGRSGTDLRGGKEWMTRAEIEAAAQRLGGGNVQGALLANSPLVPADSTAQPSRSASVGETIGAAWSGLTGGARSTAETAITAAQQRIEQGLADIESGRAQLGRDIESRMSDLQSLVERTGGANAEALGRAAERTGLTSGLGSLWETVQPPEGGRFGVGESGVGQWWKENSLLNQLGKQQEINDRYNVMGVDPDTGRYRIDASAFDRMSPEDRRVWNETTLAIGTTSEPTRIARGALDALGGVAGRVEPPASLAGMAAEAPAAAVARAAEPLVEAPTAATRAVRQLSDMESNWLSEAVRAPKTDPRPMARGGDIGLPDQHLVRQANLGEVVAPNSVLYHETSVPSARSIVQRAEQGPRTHSPIFVSENRDLALGQGGKGVMLEFEPQLVNGVPSMTKPGVAFTRAAGEGGEYTIDKTVRGAVSAIVASTERQLAQLARDPLLARRFDFANAEQTAEGFRVPRLTQATPEGGAPLGRLGGAAGAQAATTLGGAAAGGAAGAATAPEGATMEERLARIGAGAAAGAAGGTALGRVLDRPAAAAAAATGTVPTPLSDEATRLLNTVAQGGAPRFMTDSLRRIAREHDIDVTPDTSPDAVVEALRLRRDTAAGAGPRPAGAAPVVGRPPAVRPLTPEEVAATPGLDVRAAARRAYPAAAEEVPGRPVREIPERPLPEGARPIDLGTEEEIARLRLDDFPEDLQEDILNAASATDWARGQRRGVIPDEVAEEMAERYAADTTLDQMIKRGAAGRTYSTEQLRAIRNATAAQALKLNDLTAAVNAGDDSSKTLQQVWVEAEKLQRLVQIGEGARAEWGRAGRAFQDPARLVNLSPDDAVKEIAKIVGGDRSELVKRVAEYSEMVRAGNGPVEFANFWAGMKDPATFTDWVRLIRYNSMLSGPRSFEVNVISNAVEMPWRLVRDVAASTVRGRPGEVWPELQGAAAGLSIGNRAFVDTLFKGITPEAAARGEIPRSLSARLPRGSVARRVATVMEFPSRLMQAADEWAMAISYNAQLGREAAMTASREGLRGEAWSARVTGIMEKPNAHPDIMKRAYSVAERMTWKGEMGAVGTGMERFVGKTGLLGNLVMPFLRTPYHLAVRGIERSPLGLAGAVFDVARGKYGYKPSELREALSGRGGPEGVTPLGERLWDGLVGTAVFFKLYEQALEKNISAAGPESRSDRELLQSQGWQPYSVRIGNQWVSYANWGPAAIPFAMAASAAEAQRYAKATDQGYDVLMDGAARTAKVMQEMTYMQAIGAAWKGMTQPDIFGATWAQNYITSMIPFGSAVNTLAQATDPSARKIDRADALDFLQYRLPAGTPFIGGRSEVPAATDVLGRPVENQFYGGKALLPIRGSQIREDPVLQELDRRGVSVPPPPEKVTIAGVAHEVTPEEGRELQRIAGERIAEVIARDLEAPGYQKLTDEAKAKRMQQVVDQQRERAHREWLLELRRNQPEEFERRRQKGELQRQPVPVSGR